MITLRTIDAHAAGESLRLIVDGFPAAPGRTMLEKRAWVRKKQDRLRRAVLLEPRGHADLTGAVLTQPVSAGSHAGVLFLHNDGYDTMCGHAMIAVTTIVLERGLLMPGGDGRAVVYDSPAGVIRAVATFDAGESSGGRRVERVAFVNVPSFVLHGGLAVKLGARTVRADVAFGGAFYAIVDGEAAGLPLDADHLPQLRRAGMEIRSALEAAHDVVHPLEPGLSGLSGTIFTGPPHHAGADLRCVTVFADAQVDRSPSGTGSSAVMAVLDAIGLIGDGPFTPEGILGTQIEGNVRGRTMVGDYDAIVPEISGSAWITGDHTFVVHDADPLKDGFRI